MIVGGATSPRAETAGEVAKVGDLVIPLVPGLKPNWSESGEVSQTGIRDASRVSIDPDALLSDLDRQPLLGRSLIAGQFSLTWPVKPAAEIDLPNRIPVDVERGWIHPVEPSDLPGFRLYEGDGPGAERIFLATVDGPRLFGRPLAVQCGKKAHNAFGGDPLGHLCTVFQQVSPAVILDFSFFDVDWPASDWAALAAALEELARAIVAEGPLFEQR